MSEWDAVMINTSLSWRMTWRVFESLGRRIALSFCIGR